MAQNRTSQSAADHKKRRKGERLSAERRHEKQYPAYPYMIGPDRFHHDRRQNTHLRFWKRVLWLGAIVFAAWFFRDGIYRSGASLWQLM